MQDEHHKTEKTPLPDPVGEPKARLKENSEFYSQPMNKNTSF